MPSYTFSSTANAVVLRGAIPVFVDIRKDTLNIDENLIEAAITSKTKAIFPVHYAGVSANMNVINEIAKRHNLYVVEDAAQGLGATYHGKPLGTLSHLGAYSFHGTKNIISGEGGALIINGKKFEKAAEIIREKGTNRSQFLRGEIDKYTWQEVGSSYLPNELTAGLLLSQLEEIDFINGKRLKIWNAYHAELELLEKEGFLVRPTIPTDCTHNGHIYYIIANDSFGQGDLIAFMKEKGIQCTSHYVPLHSAPAGIKYGRTHGDLPVTNKIANQIVRLPLWPQMSDDEVMYVIKTLISFFRL
jgi:dTDP-4-amino-4,6-dideoxygalactose transaminase